MTSLPSAPPSNMEPITLPPSYDEAVRTVAPGQIQLDTANLQHAVDISSQDELSNEKKREEAKKNQMLQNEGTPITTQPTVPPQTGYVVLPTNPQPEGAYIYPQQNPQIQTSNDCIFCCAFCHPEDIADTLYCLFCCSRHVSGHDAGCCDCGERCCGCPDGCCNCCDGQDCDCCAGQDCDCDCGDCDCNCGDCDCDCGDVDCGGCDCGDCTIS